jgi:hypothetical protein
MMAAAFSRASAQILSIVEQALQCPLWVISGHMQCKTTCPLYSQ